VPTILRKGAEWFAGLGTAELGRHGDLLGVGPREQARQLRVAARHPVPPTCWNLRAACGRRKLKAVIPGGSSVPVVPG
jgi:NADH-quinone oxidoreductase subunit F